MRKAEDKYGRHLIRARNEAQCGLSTLPGVLPRTVAQLLWAEMREACHQVLRPAYCQIEMISLVPH